MTMVPARYVGEFAVRLSKVSGPRLDGDGNVRKTDLIEPGDTLLVPDVEVLGQTFFFDRRTQETEFLGAGRVLKPGDEALSYASLVGKGYEFHEGRADFEPIGPTSASPIRPASTEEAEAEAESTPAPYIVPVITHEGE